MFDGFSADDFNAYLPDKWGSNMFTLPRRKVREKLSQLSHLLASALETTQVGLRAHLSDDHPSLWNNKKVDTQWLFFSRDEAAERDLAEIIDLERTLAATLADPTPLYRHVFLGVAVRMDRLDVGLWLPYGAWVDRRNLLSLLAREDVRARFGALLHELPDEAEIGFAEGEMLRTRELDPDRLDALLATFEEKKGWVFLGARMPRDAVIPLGADVFPRMKDLFERIAPLYRFAAWSKENDAVSLDGVVSMRRREIQAAEAELDREHNEREEKRRALEEERRKLREETEERARAEQAWREREWAIRRAAATRSVPLEAAASTAPFQAERREQQRPAEPERAPQALPKAVQPTPQPAVPPRPQPKAPVKVSEPVPVKISEERKADIHIGDEVVVSRGFLKSRTGVVQSIEEKGDLKVAFGSLTARVPRADVEGRGPRVSQGDGDGRRASRPRKS